jgi:hypothetical protein
MSLAAYDLVKPMAAHVFLCVVLYALLTIARAPKVWGFGSGAVEAYEARISANLTNQFEWPILFYAACLLALQTQSQRNVLVGLAWVFIMGRLIHSLVQILTTNVRLRGLVFTMNFLAVLAMWLVISFDQSGMTR